MITRPSYITSEQKTEILSRFWAKDPSLWAEDPDVQQAVANRLGWLEVVPKMKEASDELKKLSEETKNRGIKRVVLLGMGGSSLCPLVLSKTFGSAQDFPELQILDTTDPEEIEKIESHGMWDSTLFVFASKSGTTIEPSAQFNYFWSILEKDLENPGRHFIAITDPGTPLDDLAQKHDFWKIFRNPPDIGGRYSALSYFGLVPAALIGIDTGKLLSRAEEMIQKCGPNVPWQQNPGYLLGEFLGEYAAQSRDKLNIFTDPGLESFGLWLEQLLAESTGKNTTGIVPVVGETTGIPGFYGGERIFAYIALAQTPEEKSLDGFMEELRSADFPVYKLKLEDMYDLGGQFFLWEMATAIASHFLEVNAFDEPDVKHAKEKTREVLDIFKSEGKIPVKFWVDPQSQILFKPSKMLAASMKGLFRTLRDMFQVLPSWGYIAFLPYLPYNSETEEIIREMRHMIRQEKGCPTTMGFGPRYLHSTGQIHKGGPISGAYVIFTRKASTDYPEIPGMNFSFWHLQFAQATGDFQALAEQNKRVIHVHLNPDFNLGLRSFSKVVSRAVRL